MHENFDFSNCIDKPLEGTKTEKNIIEAFCGESQARNKYTFFAEKAHSEGFEQISKIFEETANNEKQHAKIWFKLLNNGNIKDTLSNLESATEAEHYEWIDMYARFAQEAQEEGFDKISKLFEMIRNIEKMHMQRYQKLATEIKENKMFESDNELSWECLQCGYNIECKKAPEICPFCKHPKGYFYKK